MRKGRIRPVIAAFVVIVLLIAAFLLRLSMHRPPQVILPDTSVQQGVPGTHSDPAGESIGRVEVTADTVQDAISTLARPRNYRRSVTVERYFDGGSGVSIADVRVLDGWTRMDVSADGQDTRHVIVGNGKCWIWYADSQRVFSSSAAFSADEEQSIPTYEDVLSLDRSRITAADYRSYDTESCIYVETAADEQGYAERWWVSVESGLLVAAEKTQNGNVVYRMAGMGVYPGAAAAEDMTLPDGTALMNETAKEG